MCVCGRFVAAVYCIVLYCAFFFFKQKTAYEIRISDWRSDLCSSDLPAGLIERFEIIQGGGAAVYGSDAIAGVVNYILKDDFDGLEIDGQQSISPYGDDYRPYLRLTAGKNFADNRGNIAINLEYSKRSEEHTSALQSLMRISYTGFCLQKKRTYNDITTL